MKSRLIFQTFGLIAIIALSSCAPAVTSTPITVDTEDAVFPATETLAATSSSPIDPQPVEVQAVATSRGPNLEATDPFMVNLASGQLQLVEFFRFT